ncbi:TIGR04282 family arsenosugar biosynthesis glycosyltransferase [Oceanisphaera sp. IT1-181]|uniref:TIGR04282 family arsenosugar biosynthesis glycosyltransferase n=1 Tax=Oceanisphaera sp. IT1-181 TaxID=3081199 RepID=UPI0029CA6E53|nr:TIGR04282 family arsenosugar biosynthesis glycosyltransferase [Oceanisphaera sp. IT1-181]
MSTRIIVFAKAPIAGMAKTRLAGALGFERAAMLARHMLSSTLEACLTADIGPVELCMSPAADAPEWAQVLLPPQLILSSQGEGDLGSRMARAARRALSGNALSGYSLTNRAELEPQAQQQVLLVGTDCPQLSPELLRRAAQRLSTQDALLHPTWDGGYALLGLRQFSDYLFTDIPWSTPEVAALTQARLTQLGRRYTLAERLQDIDEPADLFWLTSAWRQTIAYRHSLQATQDV